MSEPRAADLEHVTARLRRTEQDLVAEYERNAAMLAKIGAGSSTITGRGSAADEAVIVETDHANRMTDIQLDPRALRLGSIGALQRAILAAYTAATEDADEQRAEAGFGLADPSPLQSLLDEMPEAAALLPRTLRDETVAASETDEPEVSDDDQVGSGLWIRGAS